jgi:hypothetical protein
MIKKKDPDTGGGLELVIEASPASPLINPAIVIKDWGKDLPRVKIDDTLLKQANKLRQGIRSTAQSDDLILWLELESTRAITIRLM